MLARDRKEKRQVRSAKTHRNVLVVHGLFVLEAFFL